MITRSMATEIKLFERKLLCQLALIEYQKVIKLL